MGEKTGHAIWSQLDRLDVSPTEALVLLTLAHYGIDDLPLCHPRQRQISRKTHLGLTAVKKSLFVLRQKGLVSWKTFASRRNNYSLTLARQHQPPAAPIAKTA